MRPDSGEILLDGQSLLGMRPDQICRAGIGRTFQIVRPFNELSVVENVAVGALATETDRMVAIFRKLNAETGLTILLIEHVMRAVMALSHHVVVLNYGKVIARGTPQEVTRDPDVLACYLGAEELG